ncbi:hypothetical protein FGIG_02579 [Fasciola gigantica]|uniref:Uncharacterized protein n=1 Tax=Fasciola gigantica TaxID=46835 RepID=A0A504YCN2_FASGI|nr:hypothetical protein FGIG_02579 [Fasciola gigantica]
MNSDGVLLLRRPRFQQNVTEPQTKRTRSQPFRKQSTISSLPKLHSTTRLQAIRVKRSYLPNSCKIQTADDNNMQNMFLTQLPSKISSQFCLVSKELIVSDSCENRTNFYCGNETNGNRKVWRKEPIRPVQLEPDLPYLDHRVPLYQSLVEVTREIKVALVKSHGVNIQCAIHQMPKYDPSVPLKSGPRHEIVIVESGDADSGDYGSELLG